MRVPIIMLHEVKNRTKDSANSWCLSHAKFLELIDYLYKQDYEQRLLILFQKE